jgi:hypothetical protein
MNNQTYSIPEADLFRLLEICSNANHCTPNHNKHCTCRQRAMKDVPKEVLDNEEDSI